MSEIAKSTATGAATGASVGGPWGALIGGGLGLAGGILQNSSSKSQSAKQMAFQERMSSTAHQRQVADLRAAGLNPMLSAMSGASSPSGAQAPIANIAEGATSSAVQAGLMKAQLNLLKQQAGKTQAEKTIIEKGVPKAQAEHDLWQKGIQYVKDKVKQFSAKQYHESEPRKTHEVQRDYWQGKAH